MNSLFFLVLIWFQYNQNQFWVKSENSTKVVFEQINVYNRSNPIDSISYSYLCNGCDVYERTIKDNTLDGISIKQLYNSKSKESLYFSLHSKPNIKHFRINIIK